MPLDPSAPRWTPWCGAHLGLIRTEFGRFTRQVSGYSLEHLLPENGADLAKFLVGTEGTLGMVTGATVRAGAVAEARSRWRCSATRTWRRPRTRCPGCCRTGRSRSRASTRGWWTSFRARRGDAAVPALPRGAGWLFVETAGDTEAEARAAAARLIADAGLPGLAGGHRRRRRAALWRIREDGAGLRRPHPGRTRRPGPAGRTPPSRPGSWARTCVTSPRS